MTILQDMVENDRSTGDLLNHVTNGSVRNDASRIYFGYLVNINCKIGLPSNMYIRRRIWSRQSFALILIRVSANIR